VCCLRREVGCKVLGRGSLSTASATKQRSDATVFHASKLAKRCRSRSTSLQNFGFGCKVVGRGSLSTTSATKQRSDAGALGCSILNLVAKWWAEAVCPPLLRRSSEAMQEHLVAVSAHLFAECEKTSECDEVF